MKFSSVLSLVFALIFCIISDLPAKRVFYDNFESKSFTQDAWKPRGAQLNWELSADYNHTIGGKTSLKVFPNQMQTFEEMWHEFDKIIPAHVRIWFYERGWKNKVKVDQQYLMVGDDTDDAVNFCQIGQTGNPSYDGHYAIWDNSAWHTSKAESEEERWVKMEFVLYKDGTAKIFIDDIEEFEFPSKWPHVGAVGLLEYGRNDRGGVVEGYWDDIEVFDTEEAPPFSVDPGNKLSALWGRIKLDEPL